MLLTAKTLGDQLNIKDGYRLVINEGENSGQTVFHIHMHFLAGNKFTWPPGTYNNKI
jgi:histidine triad (HIT) family protein